MLTREAEGATVSPEEKLASARDHKNNGRYEEALALYKEIIAEDPTLTDARVEIGLVYGFIGEFDLSLETLKEASEQNPHSAYAQLSLGKTYMMLGMYDESIPPLKKVLTLTDADPKYRDEAQKQLDYLKEFGFEVDG